MQRITNKDLHNAADALARELTARTNRTTRVYLQIGSQAGGVSTYATVIYEGQVGIVSGRDARRTIQLGKSRRESHQMLTSMMIGMHLLDNG